jgi:hypothetical protein
MPAFISARDGNDISPKRAALLTAHGQPGMPARHHGAGHSIFMGEFEPEECPIPGIEPTDDRNLHLLRIEAPPSAASSDSHLERMRK